MPLAYDPNRVVVIAASSPGRLEEECACYNVDPNAPGLRKVYTAFDLGDVLALPMDTPWCIVGGTGEGARGALRHRFGAEKTFADAMRVTEHDVAWRKPMTDRI